MGLKEIMEIKGKWVDKNNNPGSVQPGLIYFQTIEQLSSQTTNPPKPVS